MNEVALGSLCSRVASGGTPSRKESSYFGGGIPWVKTMDLDDGPVVKTDETISTSGLLNSSAKIFPRGTVLVAMYGATVGKLGYLLDEAACNQAACALVPDTKTCDPRWLYYLLLSRRGDLVGLASGAAQQNLNVGLVRNFSVRAPSLEVQRAIGEVLGALDDKIAANRAAISAGKNLIQAQWEQQSSGANEVRNLDEVVDLNPRTQLPAEGPHPFLDMKDLPQNGLLVDRWSERESRSGSKFRNGDTLLARITPCFENGKIGLVDFLPPDVTGLGSTEYIVLRPKDGVPQAVPYCIAASDPFRAHAARGMTGTSGRQRVQAMNIGDYPVGWPGKDALDRFGGFTDALIRRLSASRNENALLARTRDELLPLLMNGRITVKDAERAAEDVL